MHVTKNSRAGFTLIELSIVLVIIGLIVGGILVGQNLIGAASIRAQISQIEKYNTAVNTFRGKYGYLPGDMPDPYATQFGFVSRGSAYGHGDGNGTINGIGGDCCNDVWGELAMFWVDLSTAGLIDGSFNTATPGTQPGADVGASGVASYMPAAKIGNGNYVYVWAGGGYTTGWQINAINYFGISAVTAILASSHWGVPNSTKGLTAAQASTIDKKVDDGLPEYGRVLALYSNGSTGGYNYWADGTGSTSQAVFQSPDTNAITGGPSTCYDNAGNAANIKQYTLNYNGGSGLNCGLSFKFQ